MSISGSVNSITWRIIVELVSLGQYTGIWLFAQAYTGIWLFAGRIHWNLVIRWRYKNLCFPSKIIISGLGNGIRWRTILELRNPGEYTGKRLFARRILESGYIIITRLYYYNIRIWNIRIGRICRNLVIRLVYKNWCFRLKMSISGLVNSITWRIIDELVSLGQYTRIWLFAQAYTGIWLFAGRIHWNLVIRQTYKNDAFH